jgi:hypothetical protein
VDESSAEYRGILNGVQGPGASSAYEIAIQIALGIPEDSRNRDL